MVTKRPLMARLVCLALSLCLLAGCGAGGSDIHLPGPPDNGCVLDVAGVLNSDTTQHILARNQTLRAATGASLCVVTLDVLGGREIADYAAGLFDAWGLDEGGKKNSLLLLLAVEEGEYYLLQGTGIAADLTNTLLADYAWNYLERDFADGNYDAGARKVFDALYQWYEDFYGLRETAADDAPPMESVSKGGGISLWLVVALVAGAVAAALIVVKLRQSGNRRSHKRRRSTPFAGGRYHGKRNHR